jgi:lipoprotein NlpI
MGNFYTDVIKKDSRFGSLKPIHDLALLEPVTRKAASTLAEASGKVDMTAWPAPVIRVFLGQLAPDELLAAADDPNPYKKRGQLCEANFFSGEWSLRQGAKEEAARRFGLAASDCPHDFTEWRAAGAELKASGATP